uniref:Uncharacterized protein n=1 Tax=uncultured marine microorganism HF4000_48F7 TaxID=455500 RepID=B3SZS6_9ZZZZ|nr:hypothetical protein ALOHA_HF400048F7ctg1g1 [uncultured marine microorganism HF4000_48F7]
MTRRDRWKSALAWSSISNTVTSSALKPSSMASRFRTLSPSRSTWLCQNHGARRREAKHVGKPCQSKPDLDNVLKGFMDALRTDDASVYAVSASKFWSEQPGVVLSVRVPAPAWRPNWAV